MHTMECTISYALAALSSIRHIASEEAGIRQETNIVTDANAKVLADVKDGTLKVWRQGRGKPLEPKAAAGSGSFANIGGHDLSVVVSFKARSTQEDVVIEETIFVERIFKFILLKRSSSRT